MKVAGRVRSSRKGREPTGAKWRLTSSEFWILIVVAMTKSKTQKILKESSKMNKNIYYLKENNDIKKIFDK